MNELYYTPEISEFYIGFQYESLRMHSDGTLEYIQKIYDGQKPLREDAEGYPGIDEDIECGEIRAKLLDRQDIESLGFILDKDLDKVVMYKYIIDEDNIIRLHYNTDTCSFGNYISIHEDDPNLKLSETRFKGFIKNKSELKKLLVQLGI